MARGRFITFEGGEGCGKSTQVRRLKEALETEGVEVVLTREPGGTPLSEEVRRLIKDQPIDPPCDRSELLLFLAARAQLVRNVIRPALAAGKWVVSDRFSDSTLAYQGYGRGLSLAFIASANDFACEGLRRRTRRPTASSARATSSTRGCGRALRNSRKPSRAASSRWTRTARPMKSGRRYGCR